MSWHRMVWVVTLSCANEGFRLGGFNALMGLSCYLGKFAITTSYFLFQCPLGLIPHFYFITSHSNLLYTDMFQCPLGLIPHFYEKVVQDLLTWTTCFNALSGLYLISTVPLQKPRFYAVSRACFCRYLSEYSDNSRFSCMLTFWTYLMRCTYPWHWIKYSTNYNRCHPIFSLSW